MTRRSTYTCEFRTGYNSAELAGIFRTPHREYASPHPVILLNGAAATAYAWVGEADTRRFVRRMTAAGLWCISSDQGGSNYGAPVQVSALDNLLTWIDTNVPQMDVSKVWLTGASMGGMTGLQWGRANPSKVGCLIAGIPLIGLYRAWQENVLGFGTAIEASYGSEAAVAAADPLASPEEIEPFEDVITFLSGDEDVLCNYQSALEFAAQHPGATVVPFEGGHGLTDEQWDWLADRVIAAATAPFT